MRAVEIGENGAVPCAQCGCESHGQWVQELDLGDRVRVLDALADETRMGIVRLLGAHSSLCVCDFTAAFSLSQPTISHHLRVLREAGLLRVARCGVWNYYALDRAAVKDVVSELLACL